MELKELLEIASQFKLEGEIATIRTLGEGFINDTFIIEMNFVFLTFSVSVLINLISNIIYTLSFQNRNYISKLVYYKCKVAHIS